jgi:hypothetical protein
MYLTTFARGELSYASRQKTFIMAKYADRIEDYESFCQAQEFRRIIDEGGLWPDVKETLEASVMCSCVVVVLALARSKTSLSQFEYVCRNTQFWKICVFVVLMRADRFWSQLGATQQPSLNARSLADDAGPQAL